MANSIQRYPQGFIDALSIKGQPPPNYGGDVVTPVIDMMPFYARSQYALKNTANAALAEGSTVVLNVPQGETWIVHGVAGNITKTATMTALRASLRISGLVVAAESFDPFGATEAGVVSFGLILPYPVALVGGHAGSDIAIRLDILGTDATANCAILAGVGVAT